MPTTVYSQAEVDYLNQIAESQIGALTTRMTSLEARVTALEHNSPPIPPIPPTPPSKYFTPTSTWNAPLVNPTFTSAAALNGGGWINAGDYGVPVAIAKSTDPVVTINAPATWGWPAQVIQVRIKSGQGGASGTDGTLSVIDGNTAYDFWQFRRINDNNASCSAWAKTDLVTGDGWGKGNVGAGIHASGSSCIAGLIMGNELTQGINHALAVAVRWDISSNQHTGQSINSDGNGGSLMNGQRIGIPANVPVTCTTTQGKSLWQGLVNHGAFIIDTAGGSQATYFWADPLSVPANDIQVLLDPSWTAAELGKIGAALQLVN